MNKFFLLAFVIICSSATLSSQTVCYYMLIKSEIDGNTITKSSGGQFISFIGDCCYESNYKGVSVGNGDLKINKYYSNSGKICYTGTGYWGSNTIFTFNISKTALVVIDQKGNKYYYKKTTPPAGVTTCSLIRNVERNPNNDFNPTPAPTPYPPNPYNPTPTPNPTPPSPGSTPNPVQPHQVTKDCNLCHGSGKCNTCNGKHWYYGIGGTTITCPNCPPNGACSSCGGSGKKTTTEYR